MEVIIFVDETKKIKGISAEIIRTLDWIGTGVVRLNETTFEIPYAHIRIMFFSSDFENALGLRPRYFLVDGDFSYDYNFAKYVKYLIETGSEYFNSTRHLIMKLIEFALYGEEEGSED